ncbi:hypothetical protein AB0A73_21800 [Glycomyces sp. NPDC047369]
MRWLALVAAVAEWIRVLRVELLGLALGGVLAVVVLSGGIDRQWPWALAAALCIGVAAGSMPLRIRAHRRRLAHRGRFDGEGEPH